MRRMDPQESLAKSFISLTDRARDGGTRRKMTTTYNKFNKT